MQPVLVVGLALCAQLAGQSPEHLGKTLSEWRADLEAPSDVKRLLAARAIGEMAITQQRGAEEALFDAIGHADSSVRYWAALATVHLPNLDASRVASLKSALEDQVPEVRVQAVIALVGAGEEREALQTLAELLSHPNRGVRLHAAHAADAIGAKAAPLADALRNALEDEFDYVQRVARHALWVLGERPCPYRACE
jgi:HEAT repeat protein